MMLARMMTVVADLMGRERLQCIFIHPERLPELLQDIDRFTFRNDDTGEMRQGINWKDVNTDPLGAIIRLSDVPVFEDRFLPLYKFDKTRVEFAVRITKEMLEGDYEIIRLITSDANSGL